MGNRQTSLKIDHFFVQPDGYKVNSVPIRFKINDFDHMIVYLLPGHIGVKDDALVGDLIEIRFDSHMRDFEVVEDGPKIARGQGIGVIIDFTRNLYIKLWKDKSNEAKYDLMFTRWSTENKREAQNILSQDLGLGYDVFIIDYNGAQYQLCEQKDERDSKPTSIIFPHLKKYANYESDTDESSDESDHDDKESDKDQSKNESNDDKESNKNESSDESKSESSEKNTESDSTNNLKKRKRSLDESNNNNDDEPKGKNGDDNAVPSSSDSKAETKCESDVKNVE